MNLQPVNPPSKDVTLFCSKCFGGVSANMASADLDDKPGTYYCPACRQKVERFDEVGFIMAFEEGEVSEEELIEGFQHLIDSGAAWKLQGSYGRTAAALIEAGHCHA